MKINAEEMRKRAMPIFKQKQIDDYNMQVQQIEMLIKEASDKGYFYINVDELYSELIQELKQNGFKVKLRLRTTGYSSEDYYKISWE